MPSRKLPLSIMRKRVEDDHEHMVETNMIALVEYSYVCPFSSRFSFYFCFYCNFHCANSVSLREHTSTHDPKKFKTIFKKRRQLKIDITKIDCRLCTTRIDDLTAFKEHITSVHARKYYTKIEDPFLKYRLSDDNITCIICNATFPYFDKLHKHMVEHYGNYTCDVCGALFMEESRLKLHLNTHEYRKYSCDLCDKIFTTQSAKDAHVEGIHEKIPIVGCSKCDSLFYTYAEKYKHMRETHDEKDQQYPCTKCDKVYNRKKSLNEHYRRCHLKLYRHQCEYCLQKFFTPLLLRDHLTTHTGEKNYRCEFCEKSYPRLKALQQHIRIHTNDRRFKCNVCNSAFIQKVSLKCHMKSHHPDYVCDK